MSVTLTAPRPSRLANLGRTAAFLAPACAGLVVFYGALGYFFAQDDFLGLARAAGLAPRLAQPWRYFANLVVWDVLRSVGATSAWPYHLLSLCVHSACVLMLYRMLASRLSSWAALLGATFFAVHPALFDALYWITAIGDPLTLCLGLSTMAVQQRTDRWRWLAVPLFALSLITKESLALLPLVAIAYRAWMGPQTRVAGHAAPPAPARRPKLIDGIVIAQSVATLVYIFYFATIVYSTQFDSTRSLALGQGEAVRAAYAFGLGAHMWENLLTYLGWSVAFAFPLVRRFSDAVEPAVYPWAIGAIAIWLAGLASARLRSRGWLFGGVTWLLFLLPMLPLRNHTYHYYLYAPLAGAAWCVAAAADWLLGRRGAAAGPAHRVQAGAGRGWVIACAGALALTINGAVLARKIETAPFVLPELRASSVIDRARIASNVYQSLSAAHLQPGVTLLFWSPIASSLGPKGESLAAPTELETYWERNVREALFDGLGVRVMFPQVAAVRFVRAFEMAPADHRYAVYRPEGRLGVATPAELDSIIRNSAATR